MSKSAKEANNYLGRDGYNIRLINLIKLRTRFIKRCYYIVYLTFVYYKIP